MFLEPTGERVIEEHYLKSASSYLIYLFHKATYRFAREFSVGKHVLDYGCGSGYGTHYLAPYSTSITGIDIASDAIEYAQKHYQAPNLHYACVKPANEVPLPFSDASFDTVLSFQVIEHVANPKPYLSEILRILKPGGVFVCATPDRTTRLLSNQKPWNMWHCCEYDITSLRTILSSHFQDVSLYRMGGKKEMLAPEMRRTQRLAWLTLPVTLPFVPERIRIAALRILKIFSRQTGTGQQFQPQDFPFDESNLVIAPDIKPSVNLIAVARKS